MAEDYAAFKARRQAELAADPNSKAELTGTRASKPEPGPMVAHGPLKAQAEPASRPDAATGKKVVNLDRAADEEDAVAAAHKSMGRGVQALDMEAIKRADKELAGYDKKPKAEKEAIDSSRLAQAQSGLKEARNAPDIDAIVTRKAPEEVAPAPRSAKPRAARKSPVTTTKKRVEAPTAEAPAPSTESRATTTETPAAVQGSTQFSGMMAAHGQHGNLVNVEGPKPKLGKDITYFGAVGGPKAPEEGKRGGPAYNTQQAYKKHVAGGGTADTYWAERDAKKAATPASKKSKAETPETPVPAAEAPVAAETPTPVKPKFEAKEGSPNVRRAGHAHEKTVSETPAVSDSGTSEPLVTVPKAASAPAKTSFPTSDDLDKHETAHIESKKSRRPSSPVEPKAEKQMPMPSGGARGEGQNPELGQRLLSQPTIRPTMTPSGSSSPEHVPASQAGREPSRSRSPRGGAGSVPTPVSQSQQFGGGDVHHHHYYGNVNQGGIQINGNVSGGVQGLSVSGSGSNHMPSGGGQGGRAPRGQGQGSRGTVTGSPTGLQRAIYSGLHTSVNGHSIAGGIEHVTGGGHIGMEDSQGRPIGRPGDKFVQNHPMNGGPAGRGTRQTVPQSQSNVNDTQFSRARGSRQQATPSQ